MSSFADRAEAFLDGAAYDRGPWLVVAFAAGIMAWFLLRNASSWMQAIAGVVALAACGWLHWRKEEARVFLRLAAVSLSFTFVLGVAVIWLRSEMVGTAPMSAPHIGQIEGRILSRAEQPAEARVRLTLAVREPQSREGTGGRAVKVRLNLPLASDRPELIEGALIRTGARLLPPAPPLVPGGYDFARKAWFDGLAATGSTYGPLVVLARGHGGDPLAGVQRRLSAHVRSELSGTPGALAAAFASGDRGAIVTADDEAMRDAGLTHLLSISGLHVSAVIACVYWLAMRLLALWPWLVLRIRLPVLAAALAALAGTGYTLLTGAEVPTVRSCLGAGLVLLALALGREPLSIRMVAVVAAIVLLLWPEALVGPSFQMSFAAVLAIVALHGAEPVRQLLAPREEHGAMRLARHAVMLFATGVVIEAVLTPIVMFHFHRAGAYGAFANVLAIPLVTFVAMPLIALALLFDIVGLGAPIWWMGGQSLELMLAIAHFVAAQPGAVRLTPQIGPVAIGLYVAGMLWIALWRGRIRLWGLAAVAGAIPLMLAAETPDVLIARDGRQLAIMEPEGRMLILRAAEDGNYALDSLREAAGFGGVPLPISRAPAARCSADFCVLDLRRDGRTWTLLIARSKHYVDPMQLIRACDQADMVIAARSLPRSCAPRWLKIDRWFLSAKGGLAVYLGENPKLITVAESQGEHGWWDPADRQATFQPIRPLLPGLSH